MSTSIPTGDITNHNLLWYNPNDGRVVCSNAGTTGLFGGAALDTASLPAAVSALRLPSTYWPTYFGRGLDTVPTEWGAVIIGDQTGIDTSRPIPTEATVVGSQSAKSITQSTTVVGTLSAQGTIGKNCVILGSNCGYDVGDCTVAVGYHSLRLAGTGPNSHVTAVGYGAGHMNAGHGSLYLGTVASHDGGNFANCIVLNGMPFQALNPTQAASWFVRPIRSATGVAGAGPLHYIEATGEIVHVPLREPKLVSASRRFDDDQSGALSVSQHSQDFKSYPKPMEITITLKSDGVVNFSYQTFHRKVIDVADKNTDMNLTFHNVLYIDGNAMWESEYAIAVSGYHMPAPGCSASTSVSLPAGTHTVEIKYVLLLNQPAPTFALNYFSGTLHANWLEV